MNLTALWADEYGVPGGGCAVNKSSSAHYYDTETGSTHNRITSGGTNPISRVTQRGASLQTSSEIISCGYLQNTTDHDAPGGNSSALPYVTFNVIAPEDGYYDMHFSYLGNFSNMVAGKNHFMVYTVNDEYAQSASNVTKDGYTQVDKKNFKLVKGLNFVRMILFTADQKDSWTDGTFWIDVNGVWVDPKLKGVPVSEAGENELYNFRLKTKYKWWGYKNWPGNNIDNTGGEDQGRHYDSNYFDQTNWTNHDRNNTEFKTYLTANFKTELEKTPYYTEHTGSDTTGTGTCYRAETNYPYFSRTLYAPIAGYYNMHLRLTGLTETNGNKMTLPVVVNGEIIFRELKAVTNDSHVTINVSVYLNEGKNVMTFFAPFGPYNNGYCNIQYFYYNKMLTDCAVGEQLDPVTMFDEPKAPTFVDPEDEPADSDSGWIYAYDYASTTGVLQGSGGTTLDPVGSPLRISALKPNGDNWYSGVGDTSGIYKYADMMQTAESMQSEGYLNKTGLPIVTYHIKADVAGTYDVKVIFKPAVREDYSYEDIFIVASANDKEFKKMYFNHVDETVQAANNLAYKCENCKNGHCSYDGNGGGSYTYDGYTINNAHHSLSSTELKLEKGINVVRFILATGETAPMLNWMDFEGIRVTGPSVVTALSPSSEKVTPATQASRTNYNVTDFTETDPAGTLMTDYAGEKKIFGHTHTMWPKYGIYDKTLYIGEIEYFSSFSIKVHAPENGYYDVGLLFRYGTKGYKGKHAVFIDGYKHFYYAQDNTNYIYKNMMNLSMYLGAGDHIITVTCPTDYNYTNRIAADGVNVENNWTDFGNMYLYGGLTYVGSPSTSEVLSQETNTGRLEAEHFAYGNEVGQTRQLNSAASGDGVIGHESWSHSRAQPYCTLDNYIDASNMRYVTFMVEAPADGEYTITPGYSLLVPSSAYFLSILVNGKDKYQLNFEGRGSANSPYKGATTKTDVNSASIKVKLVKGVNTIMLFQGVNGSDTVGYQHDSTESCSGHPYNNQSYHNGTNVGNENGENYLNFDFLDIDEGLVGIPVHYEYDYDKEKYTYADYKWDDNSAGNVGHITTTNTSVALGGYSVGETNTFGHTTFGQVAATNAWVVSDSYYTNISNSTNSNYVLNSYGNYKADTLKASQLANGTTGVPYISFKVKADKAGYYQILSHFNHEETRLYYMQTGPFYVSVLVDGKPYAVGAQENEVTNEYDDTTELMAFHTRMTFVPYLTEGEHTITFTAPLETTKPIGTRSDTNGNCYVSRLNYTDFYLFGLKHTGKPSSAEINEVLPNSNLGDYNGEIPSDEEAFYASRGAASSAAIALKNAYNYTDPDGITNEFEDSEAVIAFVNEAIALIQYTDYKANGGYSYNGKDYKTDYQSYFDDILADLKQDIIDQKQKEFDAFKAAKFETVVVLLKGKLQSGEIDQSKYDQLYDLAQKQFDGIPYDTTKPVTTSARNVHALYGKFAGDLDKLIDDMKRFEEHRQECIEQAPNVEEKGDDPLTKVTETEYSDPQTVKDAIDTSVKELEDLVYDFNLDILDNIARLDEIITDLEDEADTLRKVRYYQSGIWMQYQLHTEVENQDHAFIRLFFEIDTVRNDYLDYGFYFTFTDEEYALPEDENPYKMSFYNVDPAKDLTVTEFASQTPENDQDLEYFYPYNFDKNEQANRFVFAFFIVPKEMFNVTYTFNAYVKDKNGEYIGKTRKFNLYDYYTGKGLIL